MLIKCIDGKTIDTDKIKKCDKFPLLNVKIGNFLENESKKEIPAFQLKSYPAYMALTWAIEENTSGNKGIYEALFWGLYEECVEPESTSFHEEYIDYSEITNKDDIFESSDEFVYKEDLYKIIEPYYQNIRDDSNFNEYFEANHNLPIRAVLLFSLGRTKDYPLTGDVELVNEINYKLPIYRIRDTEAEDRKFQFKDGTIDCGKLKDALLEKKYSRRIVRLVINQLIRISKDSEVKYVKEEVENNIEKEKSFFVPFPLDQSLIYEFKDGSLDFKKLLEIKGIYYTSKSYLSEMVQDPECSIDSVIDRLKEAYGENRESEILNCITRETRDGKLNDTVTKNVEPDNPNVNTLGDGDNTVVTTKDIFYELFKLPKKGDNSNNLNAELTKAREEIARLKEKMAEKDERISELIERNNELEASNKAYKKKLEDIGDILMS